ncbi:hypothetical protein LSCM1_03798 [Leishmania martiniquensis]|uniref:Abnormal spindle-like microcephaly-associated protein ASH domain-containing protein n=1 Tax=Leishmania martiniquensis TaxID=1580590 RepID=A0A836KDL2_9TRYP|nr:hypothetical protein LSCM1_03798 [Leishmania martiniquensis]
MLSSSPEMKRSKAADVAVTGPSNAPLARQRKRVGGRAARAGDEKGAVPTGSVAAAAEGASASFIATGGSLPIKRSASSSGLPLHQSAHAKGGVTARVPPTHRQASSSAAGTAALAASSSTQARHAASARSPDFPFDVNPTQIVFDSFEANHTYTATLELKNHTMTSTHVHVDRPSPCTGFELSAPRGAGITSRVAPGLSVIYTLIFNPRSNVEDYRTQLVVRAESGASAIVPVRAYAVRGHLQLPAELLLREAPLKGTSSTPLFLRNVSEQSCVWQAMVFDVSGVAPEAFSHDVSYPLSSHFSITPSYGVVEPLCGGGDGAAMSVAPVTLHFHPPTGVTASGTYGALLRFFMGPEGDLLQDVQLSAQAVELTGIVLEQTEVTLKDTYVTTERQAVVRLRNDSEYTVHFAWKRSYRGGREGDSDDDDGRATGGDAEVGGGTTVGSMHGSHTAKKKSELTSTVNGSDGDGSQHSPHQLFQGCRAAWDDYTGDEAFCIEPLSGVLYGRGAREFTITFNPHVAVLYESMAFLDVTGLVNRLPLTMRGHGLGPQCILEHRRLEIGDVYLNALHEYEVGMENISPIECRYVIMPPLPVRAASATAVNAAESDASRALVDFSGKFRFIPSHGTLGPGEVVKLRIQLQSDIIGCFAEVFRVHMEGAVEEVPLLIKGRVLGPHFHCSVEELDFGNVSYNLTHARTIEISNTSPIPMHYALRLPDECNYADDLTISPSTGAIAPMETQTVTITLHSRTVGDYETAVLIEVADVGDVLDAIPLKATCMVPPLLSNTTELAFGGIFVGYPATLNMMVLNDSALTGMFELSLVGGDALSDVVKVELPVPTEPGHEAHWILPHETVQMPVTVTALRPGKLHFSIALRVLGMDVSGVQPQTILVSAMASGPHVEMQPSTFQFGTIDVLSESVKELTLKNTSPVPALFSLAFDRYGSISAARVADEAEGSALATLPFPRVPVFTMEPADGVLEPHSTLTVLIRAKPDEAIAFTDTLRLRHSPAPHSATAADETAGAAERELVAAVKVTGKGIPIVSERSVAVVELGDVLTTAVVSETITLHNYGRRDQEVQWQNTRSAKVKEGEPPVAFNYKPERVSIPGSGALTFTICGQSGEAGVRTETFTLKQSGTFREIMRSTVTATFITPTLLFSARAIHFDFANRDELQVMDAPRAASLVRSLTIKNVTSKTLVVSLRIRHAVATTSPSTQPAGTSSASKSRVPFELEGPSTLVFAPGDSYVVGVRCNPLYRGDFTSHTTKAKMQLSFAHHARKEHVNLSAALRFPALVISPSALLEFGVVLRSTEKRRTILLSNPSADLPAHFEWALRPRSGNSTGAVAKAAGEDGVAAVEAQRAGDKVVSHASSAGDEITAAAVRCFDIVPFTGILQPGESRSIEVTYQGEVCGSALATAVCRVRGGPTYTIDVHAASSVVQAHLDRTEINFGRLPYYESATQSVMLSNSTLVPVTWDVDLSRMLHPECVRVSPVSGVLRDKVRLVVIFTPTVPDAFEETLWVRIGHLDPQPIRLRGSAYMNRLLISTMSPTTPAIENDVVVSRAPFRAFIEALQYVESQSSASPQTRSVYASRTVAVLPTAPTAAAGTSPAKTLTMPPVVQREWATLEAERLAFCRAVGEAKASEHSSSMRANDADRSTLFLPPRALRRTSLTAISGSSGAGGGTEKLVLARYIVDFGHLTRHDVRKVTLKLTNPSATEGVSAMVDSKELEHLPVSVDPVKGIKVGPLETVSLALVMDATKPESLVCHGDNRYEFSIDVRHGPAIVVECHCYVATPSLRAAEKEVKFGPVLLGEVKVLPLLLINPEAVSCPWRITCKAETPSDNSTSMFPERRLVRGGQSLSLTGPAATERLDSIRPQRTARTSQFWVKEDHGVVAASGTTAIDVYFAPSAMPAEGSSGAATATLRFRCGRGPAESVLTVKLSGTSFQHDISLSTTQLSLPVARPHQVIHESVTLTNNEEHPVEVFSLGLDTQHIQEVKLLRRALEMSPNHELVLPSLEAGDNLPDALLESIFNRLHAASESLKESPSAAVLAASEAALESALPAVVKGGKASRRQSTSAASRASSFSSKGGRRGRDKSRRQSAADASGGMEKGLGDGSAAVDGIAEHQGAADGAAAVSVPSSSVVLLVGPPRSGKTALARHMTQRAEAGSVVLVDVDELVRREADCDDSANGAVARFLLSHVAGIAPEPAPSARADGANATSDVLLASYVACAPKLVRDVVQQHLSRCIAGHAASSTTGAAPLDGNGGAAASKPRPLRLLFDGLNCGVLQNPWRLFELIRETCDALRIPLQIVSLAVSDPMSGVRRAEALESHHEARVTAASLTLLSEGEFEALDKEARDHYTRRLKHFNDCRRDLKDAQQLKRDYMAQLPRKTVQQEVEETFAQARLDGQQQSASLDASMRSGRKGRAAGGAGRAIALAAEAAKKLQEPKWAELDAAMQFREWYTRFLGKYGEPPRLEGEEGCAAGATTANTRVTTPQLKGAAAAAAAAAQERANRWAAVIRVASETETPREVSELVEWRLAQRAFATSAGVGTASTATPVLPTLSPFPASAALAASSCNVSGEGQLPSSLQEETGTTAASSAMPAIAAAQDAPSDAAAMASEIVNGFYLNESRLRSWVDTAIDTERGVASAMGQPLPAEEAVAAKATAAVAAVAGAGEAHALIEAAGPRLATDPLRPEFEASATVARYVHFFSTLEREVIPAKKGGIHSKSVPAVVSQEEECTRWWLPPRSSVTLTLEFCGDHVGPYTETCLFGVVGTLQKLRLTVSALVALPDISRDPKDIFPLIVPRSALVNGGAESSQRVPKAYVASKKLFDFGPLLIPPPPVPKGRRRSNEKAMGLPASTVGSGRSSSLGGSNHGHTSNKPQPAHLESTLGEETLTFVNREASEAEVTLSFLNEKEKTFTVAPTSFVLKPGTSQQVSLRATPEKVGSFTNTLLACIKENPLPWKTKVTCTGARPTLTVNGCKDLEVNFGRLVLNRSVERSFLLANEGLLPLQWKLVPVVDGSTTRSAAGGGGGGGGGGGAASSAAVAAQWPAELQCSAMEGVIKEGGTYTLKMTFAPTHPCLYTRNVLFMVSYPGHPQQIVYESVPAIIRAEGYDVVLEWTREIHLGVLHVGEEKHETVRILNKSPYEVGYQLKLPKRLQRSVKLSSSSGTLRGIVGFKDAAIVNVDVVAHLEKEGELPAKLSMIEVAFFDVEKNELLYPVQSIPVTGEAWYTKYTIQPPSVNFGSCLIGQMRQSSFELRNTGVFPLEYSLFNYRDAAASTAAGGVETETAVAKVVDVSPSRGAAAAATAAQALSAISQRSSKAAKGSELDISIGAFTCCPCRGVIPVGGAQTITVSTIPAKQHRSHETIGVRVEQSGPELERYGTPVEVSAYPAVPSIAADLTSSADVETIFEEQRVVYRLDQLAKSVRAYSKEERIFSFGTTLVGQRTEERFRIANSSPLPCTVVAYLEGSSVTGVSATGGGASASRGNASSTSSASKPTTGGGVGGGGAGAAGGTAGRAEAFDLCLDCSGGTAGQTRATLVKMALPPYESRFLTIGFTATSLRRFQAQLVATVEGAVISSDDGAETGQQLRFGLSGEGTLPNVEVQVPPRLSLSAVPWCGSSSARPSGPCGGSAERMHRRIETGGISSGSERKRAPRRGGGGAACISSPLRNGHAEGYSGSVGTTEVLELPLTRVGAISSRSFTLRNTGCVTAEVHLELLAPGVEGNGGPNPVLTVSTVGGAGGRVCGKVVKKQRAASMRHSVELFVPAGQSESVELTYAPTQVEATMTRMRVVLRDNPFEEKEVYILSRSFDSPISFEGIDPSSSDFYDVGDCWVGVEKSCTFTVRNNTDSLVRYEWQYAEPVVLMVPSVGHLSAGATRQITAVMRNDSQNLHQVARCAILVQSIQLLTNALGGGLGHPSMVGADAASGSAGGAANPVSGATNAAITEWDNSMQTPKWVLREDDTVTSTSAAGAHSAAVAAAFLSTAASMVGRRNLKQVMEPLPEPPYTVVDAVTVTQPLTLGCHCSVPTYKCELVDAAAGAVTDLKAISFEHTYLMQKRVAMVRVSNTGTVGLPLTYSIATSGEEGGAAAQASSKQDSRSPHARRGGSIATAAGGASRASLWGPALEGDTGALSDLPGYTAPAADFSVVPSPASSSASAVPPGSHLDLNVEFTPRAVGLATAELILSMPYSDPAEVRVPVQGVAECPLVHFDIPPATYPDVGSIASSGDAASQGQERVVVQFLARGLHTTATVKFPVVNPTATAYSYEWVEEGMRRRASGSGDGGSGFGGGTVSPFRCLTPMGVIAAGRQAEAIFEFFADALGVRESAWSFQIPGRAAIPFVLVGTAVEPNVYFHASKVVFGHVQVGTQLERAVVLENCDDVPYTFSWDKLSMGGTSSFLSVRPLRGAIAPYERLSVTVTFSPQDEVEYNVPLRCLVKRSSVPLSINVKGTGVSVHDSLQMEPFEDGAQPMPVVRGQPLLLNLDRVQVNSTIVRRFALRNTGTYSFYYSVEAPENASVSLEGMEGEVAPKQTGVIVFRYHPTCEETLRQCRLLFRIEGKVAYKVGIRATAYLPRLQLSFDHHDFGPRFISAYNNGLATTAPDVRASTLWGSTSTTASGAAVAVLQLTNLESEVVSVDCSMSAQNTWCRLDSTALVVRPRESARLRLTFVPPEVRQYEDNLRLSFNALHTVFIPLTGEGVVPRVEVVNPFAKFGVARIGENQQTEVKLTCLSKIPTPVSFTQAIDDDLRQKGFAISLPGQTAASPSASSLAMTLKPKESATVVLSFAPKQRMGEFSREVKMLVCGVEVPFVSVSGSCADAEVHLDTPLLLFRDVVVGASATRRVCILNSGDISQRFSWASSLQKLRPSGEWSIFPSSGYIRAHTELSCELRYTPSLSNKGSVKAAGATASSAPLQQVLTLELDSSASLALTIESNCVTRPAATDTVTFACRAHETDVKQIELYNPLEDPWTTEPVLDSMLWACPTHLTLKPKATTMLNVTYKPVRPTVNSAPAAGAGKSGSSTSDDAATAESSSKDKATLFIPLPDGTGRCVALEGTAEAAGSAGPVQEYDTVVQVTLPLYFQVRNWSTTETARFRREVEWNSATRTTDDESGQPSEPISNLVRVEDGDVGGGDLKGSASARFGRPKSRGTTAATASQAQNVMELPPGTSRESVLKVTPLREGVYKGTVQFVPLDKPSGAASMGTVQFYEFVICVRPAQVSAPTTVDLRAGIREVAGFPIPLTNPLSKPVVFKLDMGALNGTASTTAAAAAAANTASEALAFPSTVAVPAHSHAQALVQFFPLIAKPPMTLRCTMTSAELGTTAVFIFRLLTTCSTAAPERTTRLVCPLGQHTNFALHFTHYSKTNTEFSIRVGGEALGKGAATFTRVGASGGGGQGSVVRVSACPPPPPATSGSQLSRGQEVAVEFSYEPSELGEATETIEFVSPVAGTYTFPIVATCTLPERQGPFVSHAGQNLQLPFKNVFGDSVTITVLSDSPSFAPSRKAETIAARKTANVTIQCKPEDDVEVARGRIIISCVPPAKQAPNQPQQPIQWVYYVEATNASDRGGALKQPKAKR